MKRALITGVTGQDGAYLSRLLLERGYRVFGGTRRASTKNTWRLEELGILDDVKLVEIELRWEGTGIDEEGIDPATGRTLVRVNPRFFRPAEVDVLIGDSSRAEEALAWSPRLSFRDLAREMAEADHERVRRGKAVY